MNALQIESYVDAAAAALSLDIAAEYRAGVIRYFTLAETMAQLVYGLPLEMHDETAEAFVPIAPVAAKGESK